MSTPLKVKTGSIGQKTVYERKKGPIEGIYSDKDIKCYQIRSAVKSVLFC